MFASGNDGFVAAMDVDLRPGEEPGFLSDPEDLLVVVLDDEVSRPFESGEFVVLCWCC